MIMNILTHKNDEVGHDEQGLLAKKPVKYFRA